MIMCRKVGRRPRCVPKKRNVLYFVTLPVIWSVILAVILVLAQAAPVMAETGDETEDITANPSKGWSKFSLHGYLNMAYGETDGHKYRGVGEGGTTDLRNAALQLRYEATTKDELVVQVAHERVGTSPTNEFRDDLELDWAFWSHQFSNGTRLRIGRVPLPIGIYNEIKDVGIALPFYRPSGNYYGEGTWTSDSVDGVVLTHRFALGAGWELSADAYYGSWKRIETDGGTLSFGEADIDDALGVFVWFEAPFAGLRIGLGINEFESSNGLFLAPGVTDDEETRYFSLEVGGDTLKARFEISRRDFTGGYWQPYYAELIYKPTDRWQIAGLYDVGHLLFEIPFFATFDDEIEELYGLGVSYGVRNDLVLKLEHQWVEGYGQLEDVPLNIFFDQPVKVNLLLFSVAFGF